MINFKDIWFSAEEKAVEFSKKPALKRFSEISLNVLHTVFLLFICVLVFTFTVTVNLIELLIARLNKIKKPVEDQVTEVSEKDLYPKNNTEPDMIKKMRDAGQI